MSNRVDTKKPIAIIGAGLTGAALAYELGWRGYDNLQIFEQRDHVGGNVHTERRDGVMVHCYGPHIFHTNNQTVWDWMRQFCTLIPYIQRTKGLAQGRVYSLPINLHTINQFFGKQMTPVEARAYIAQKSMVTSPGSEATNLEEYAIDLLGAELYCAFIRDYTIKQWGMHPSLLPATVLKRLPMRFTYEDNAFDHRFQGIPKDGYTAAIKQMIGNVPVNLNEKFSPLWAKDYAHVFYSGPLDEWFGHRLGRLPYRTLDFEHLKGVDDLQGCAVLNSCDIGTSWTRSTEHRHFTPWEIVRPGEPTIVSRERPRPHEPGDIHYYPVRLARGQQMLDQYQALALAEKKVSFVGRLGTFRYLDMDVTIREALETAKLFWRSECGG